VAIKVVTHHMPQSMGGTFQTWVVTWIDAGIIKSQAGFTSYAAAAEFVAAS
jgi:hypothetical protein